MKNFRLGFLLDRLPGPFLLMRRRSLTGLAGVPNAARWHGVLLQSLHVAAGLDKG
jgi:hypothetical protein